MRTRLLRALGVLLGACSASAYPAAAVAQTGGLAGRLAEARWNRPSAGAGPALDAFYTRVRAAGAPGASGARAAPAAGLGGRLMWPLGRSPGGGDPAGPAGAAPASWLARHASVGLFGAYVREPDRAVSAGQAGVAAEVAPFAGPVAGRVEPFAWLGAGALHTVARGAWAAQPAPRPLEAVDGTRAGVRAGADLAAAARTATATHFLLVPGVGARVRVRPGVAVQGDVRQLVTFGGARRAHPAASAGLRLAI